MEQVFTIHPKGVGYLVTDGNIDNTIYVANRDTMRQLYDRIDTLLTSADVAPTPPPPKPDMMTSDEAIAHAAQDGLDLPLTTLNSACTRNSIRGAVKAHDASHSRWQIPRTSFLYWYETWAQKARRRASQV